MVLTIILTVNFDRTLLGTVTRKR